MFNGDQKANMKQSGLKGEASSFSMQIPMLLILYFQLLIMSDLFFQSLIIFCIFMGFFSRTFVRPSSFIACLFLCSSVKLWASAFGGEIKSISAKYSGSQLLQKVFKFSLYCVRLNVFSLCGMHMYLRALYAVMLCFLSEGCRDIWSSQLNADALF